jgi:hypothetical protein
MESTYDESLLIPRYSARIYLLYKGLEVDDNYSFVVKDKRGMKEAYIRHFGYIEIEGETYSFIDFLDRQFRQKRSTIINDVNKRLGLSRSAKKQKLDTLPHLNGYQSSIMDLEDEEAFRSNVCRYQVLKLLSDTPENAIPETFPYRVAEGGVLLHDVYKSLFTHGEIPIFSIEKANMLLCAYIGFDKERGCPVKINRIADNATSIELYYPSGDIATANCFDYSKLKLD